MHHSSLYKLFNYFIASVWFINGLVCKVLNLVPRHQQIVADILGAEIARPLTIGIGFAEILMAVWLLSGIKSKFNAVFQIGIIILMNVLEFIFVPETLLWGKFNAVFALSFCALIYFKEFVLTKKLA